jgi:transcription antitermination factor NusG
MPSQWFVIRTRPQWERIVSKQLHDWYKIEGWCPLQKLQRQYTDRKKIVETPVFKSYVFVKLNDYNEYTNTLKLDGVVHFIKYDNKPAGISEEEMKGLQEFTSQYNQIEVSNLQPGKIVTINKGVFTGHKGIVQYSSGNKVSIELPRFGFRLEATREQVAV